MSRCICLIQLFLLLRSLPKSTTGSFVLEGLRSSQFCLQHYAKMSTLVCNWPWELVSSMIAVSSENWMYVLSGLVHLQSLVYGVYRTSNQRLQITWDYGECCGAPVETVLDELRWPMTQTCHLSYQPYSHPALMFDLTDNKMFKGLIAWNIFFLINFNKTVFLHYQKPSCSNLIVH